MKDKKEERIKIRISKSLKNDCKTLGVNISEVARLALEAEVHKKQGGTLLEFVPPKSVICTPRLEEIYQAYPRKIGKKKGFELARRLTSVELEKLKLAIENYKQYVKENRIEDKFVKHFSSFMSDWQDWIEKPVARSTTRGIEDILRDAGKL